VWQQKSNMVPGKYGIRNRAGESGNDTDWGNFTTRSTSGKKILSYLLAWLWMLEHLTLEVAKLRGPLCFAKSHVIRRDPDPKLDPYKVVAVSVL